MSRVATDIAIGRVTNTQSRFAKNEFGDQIVRSKVDFTVEDGLKSKLPARLTINAVGGTVGQITHRSSAEAFFEEGERAIVFLRREGANQFSVVGGARGKLTIDKEGIVVELGAPWQDVRSRILAAVK